MATSKTEIMEVFSQLSPENQRTLLLCAKTAEVAEEAAMRRSRYPGVGCGNDQFY